MTETNFGPVERLYECDDCDVFLALEELHTDEGDRLLCDNCFLRMMNEANGTNYRSLEEAGYSD